MSLAPRGVVGGGKIADLDMKLTIERAALMKALGHVQSAVERRNTIPILSNVLLSAERDRLTFSATDLDMEIIDEAMAQVDQPGQITAPGGRGTAAPRGGCERSPVRNCGSAQSHARPGCLSTVTGSSFQV